mmetsp:Transcript_88410/g.234810  ORF Transcript_88410/g.234810 Transcript_88410/m.234810 type:complete len:223 (+) Transcript_88410:782-1450(+)
MAAASSSTDVWEKRPVAAPIFLFFTSAAMSCWSAKTGVMTVGQPAASEACVVPMPPWCTAAWHCGKSHSCGALLRKSTRPPPQYSRSASASGAPSRHSGERPAQPPRMMPRLPALLSAPTARAVMCSLEYTIMEPQPMYTGRSPDAKNCRVSSWEPLAKKEPPFCDIASCWSLSMFQRPTTSMPPCPGRTPPPGQSAGAGQKEVLKAQRLSFMPFSGAKSPS